MLTNIAWVMFFAGISAYAIPLAWRTGYVNRSGRAPGWWPYGAAGWLAYARLIPSACIGMCLGMASFVVGGLISSVLLWAGAAWLVVAGTAILVNQPKFVVPPARRHDPGLAVSWWRVLRSRLRSR